MDQHSADDGCELLRRGPILAALREGPLTRRGVQDRLDLARTTAYRITIDLEERGLIERTGSEYSLTGYGSAVVGSSERFLESLVAAEQVRPVLDHVDEPELVASLHAFTDAEVLVPDARDPFRLFDWWTEHLQRVERMRVLTVSTGRAEDFEIVASRIDAGADVEAVFSPDALAKTIEVAPQVLTDVIERLPGCAFVHESVPFNCSIFDDTVAIVGIDDRTGIPAAYLVTDAPEARQWAESFFRRFREGAEELTPEDLID